MKKRYIVLTLVGLFLGYTAQSDNWFVDEREVYFPITKEQIRAHAKALQENPEFRNTVGVSRPQQDETAFFDMVKKKIGTEYPVVSNLNNKYEREVSRRLGLLKTMQYQWPEQKSFKQLNTAEVKNYFRDVVRNENENILVRRQAYKNWLSLNSQKDFNTEKVAGHQQDRLAQLVNFSDSEMMKSLTVENEH